MRVIETKTGWLWCKYDAAFAVCWKEGRALFGSAVHIDGNLLAVPMQLLRSIGVVVNVNGDLPAFLETKKRSRKLSVVGGSRDDSLRSNLDRRCFDMQGVVRVAGIIWRIGCRDAFGCGLALSKALLRGEQ